MIPQVMISNNYPTPANCCEVCRREITGNVNNTCPDLIDVKGSISSSTGGSNNNNNNGQSLSQKLKQNHKKVCTACKKFYRRIKLLETELFTKECTCVSFLAQQRSSFQQQSQVYNGALFVQQSSGGQQQQSIICRACRARKCHSLLSAENAAQLLQSPESTQTINNRSNNVAPNNEAQPKQGRPRPQISVRLIPCEICETSSSGYHFGAMTCEGCKGFFRRAVGRNYACCFVGDIASTVSYQERIDKCKHCRLEACLRAGMSLARIKRGRRSLLRRLDTSLYVKRLHDSNQLLANPVSRRKASTGPQHPHHHHQAPHHQQYQPRPQQQFKSEIYHHGEHSLQVAVIERAASMPPLKPEEPSTSGGSLVPVVQDSLHIMPEGGADMSMPTYLLENSDLLQQASEAAKYLLEVRANPGVILTFDMTPLAMWQVIISGVFERNVNAITAFDRALPGFRQIFQGDKQKLFVHSYFGILFAELSMDFLADSSSSSNGPANYISAFSLKDTQSVQAFQQSFHYVHSLVQQKLYEAGTYAIAWRPSPCEFALFCGLLFFNPNVPGLTNADTVAHIFSFYHQTYLEAVRLRLAAGSSYVAEEECAKLNSLVAFFSSTITPVFVNAMQWLANYLPESVNCHLFWTEMNRSLGIPA